MKNTQTLLRQSFNLILNSSRYLCLCTRQRTFCIYVFPYIFSRPLHPASIYRRRIWHCYLFKWPSRVHSQIFQHHPCPFQPDLLFLCTFHSPSYLASTGNEKRPILASFISWIYARPLFNKRSSLATATPDRSTSDFCRKWQFSYCRRHSSRLRKISARRVRKSLRYYLYSCRSNSFTVEYI